MEKNAQKKSIVKIGDAVRFAKKSPVDREPDAQKAPRAWAQIMKTYNSKKYIKKYLDLAEITLLKETGNKVAPKTTDYSMHTYTRVFTTNFYDEKKVNVACKKFAEKAKGKISEILNNTHYTEEEIWKKINEIKNRRKKQHIKLASERRINTNILKENEACNKLELLRGVKLGANLGYIDLRRGKKNGLEVCKYYDNEDGYARSCRYTMVRYNYVLTVRRGWRVRCLDGKLTFIKKENLGKSGVKCEWVEQGRALDAITIVKGIR